MPLLLAAGIAAAPPLGAQQDAPTAQTPSTPGQAGTANPPSQRESVVVTGTWAPVPLTESDRSVNVYPLPASALLFGSLADALDVDASVQVQSRAPNGVQGDISIRGGTFEQTLFLVNGIRLSDAQSAHNNFDLPIPLDAIERIEVMRGSGSTLYGSEAVAGVVNIVTRPVDEERPLEMRLRAAYGSFGTNDESGFLAFREGALSQRFSFERELSDGFRDDREYRNLVLGSESWFRSKLGLTRVLLSYMDRPFGADQFYGDFNSWERTKTWLATFSQDLGKSTLFSLGYRRHTDLYELLRDDPTFYTNRHKDDTWDIALRSHATLPHSFLLYYGAEALADHVNSTNLGVHSRKQGAVYGALDIRAWRRFSFNVGMREEFFGAKQTVAVPTWSGGYWLSDKIKLRGSISRAFRLPNYTDLYYSDPADLGNPNLQPETAWNYEAGVDFHPSVHWRGSVVAFSRRETNDIDYVRPNDSSPWQATNFGHVNFTGWEALLAWSGPHGNSAELQYTGLHGAQSVLGGLQSKYAFNYPTQQAIVGWNFISSNGWLARVRTGVTNQYGRNAYVVMDAYAAWTKSMIHPYARITNITNADYQPVYGVVMPGRAVLGGIEWCVLCKSR